MMTDLVLIARDVVDAVASAVCVKVDGEKHGDLANRCKVTACPTSIILTSDRSEFTLNVEYLHVVQIADFLKSGERYPRCSGHEWLATVSAASL